MQAKALQRRMKKVASLCSATSLMAMADEYTKIMLV